MRSFVAAVLLFSLTIGCVIFNALYVNSKLDEIYSLTEEISASPSPDSLISRLKKLWESSREPLGFSIKENKIEKMSELIESLYAAHIAKNSAEFQKLCILIRQLCEEIKQYERISVYSVF